ncbi:MAG: hypothetical protein ACKVOR_14260 [Flavobacteriales bacterium]
MNETDQSKLLWEAHVRHHAELNVLMKTLDHYSVSKTIKRIIGVFAEIICYLLFLGMIGLGIYAMSFPLFEASGMHQPSGVSVKGSISIRQLEELRLAVSLLIFVLSCVFLFVALLLREVRKRNALLRTAYNTVGAVVMEKERLTRKSS